MAGSGFRGFHISICKWIRGSIKHYQPYYIKKNKAIVIINGLISIVLVGLIAYKTAAFIEGGGPYSKAVERKFI